MLSLDAAKASVPLCCTTTTTTIIPPMGWSIGMEAHRVYSDGQSRGYGQAGVIDGLKPLLMHVTLVMVTVNDVPLLQVTPSNRRGLSQPQMVSRLHINDFRNTTTLEKCKGIIIEPI